MTNQTGQRLPVTFAVAAAGLDFQQALSLAQAAEVNGFSDVSFSDRPHDPAYDGWTLSTAVAARTERIRVFHATLNIPYRVPALIARQAATLDLVSNGRLDLCLGAGGEGNRAFYDSIGVPLATPGERLQDLRDTITILRGLWSNQKFSYQGRVLHVDGVDGRPHPVQRSLPIWVGARLPRSLRLVGQLADGFLKNQGWAAPEEMQDLNRQVNAAARKAGRDPIKIRRIINGSGFLTSLRDQAPAQASPATGLVGSATAILDQVRAYRAAGVDMFTLRFPVDQAVEQIRRFGSEVVPEAQNL